MLAPRLNACGFFDILFLVYIYIYIAVLVDYFRRILWHLSELLQRVALNPYLLHSAVCHSEIGEMAAPFNVLVFYDPHTRTSERERHPQNFFHPS